MNYLSIYRMYVYGRLVEISGWWNDADEDTGLVASFDIADIIDVDTGRKWYADECDDLWIAPEWDNIANEMLNIDFAHMNLSYLEGPRSEYDLNPF